MHITASEVNSLGLALDISGALMLWKFVAQNPIKEMKNKNNEVVAWQLSDKTLEDAFNVSKKHGKLSQAGILLLVLGFVLQLWSNFL